MRFWAGCKARYADSMRTFFIFAGLPLTLFVLVPLGLGAGTAIATDDMQVLFGVVLAIVPFGIAIAALAALMAWAAYAAVSWLLARQGKTLAGGFRFVFSLGATLIACIPVWPFIVLVFLMFLGGSFS